ncbi:GIP [Symbiodinium sp. CCMP2456]|nr:GIP [Symbiodinium sp. CCMP2456]
MIYCGGKLSITDITRFGGFLGALQWPAGQGVPALSATMSLLAADVTKATVALAQEVNKALRFAKSNVDMKLTFGKTAASWEESACFAAFSDAAFGTRSDHSSQRGYIVILTHVDILMGKTQPYAVVIILLINLAIFGLYYLVMWTMSWNNRYVLYLDDMLQMNADHGHGPEGGDQTIVQHGASERQ